MGPYLVDHDTLEVSLNPQGWDNALNILFVDQPIGVGFSYSHSSLDRVRDENRLADDMLDFVREFLEVHPNLKQRDLFVTGESYAGHYIPNIAHRIWQFDQLHHGDGVEVRMAGLAIGNGLTVPTIQMMAYSDFAYQNGLIDKDLYEWVKFAEPYCKYFIEQCKYWGWASICTFANQFCMGSTYGAVMSANPDMNMYDIRVKCGSAELCYDTTWVADLLNDPDVQAALGVSRQWVACNWNVYQDFAGDWMRDDDGLLPDLLASDARILIYAGDRDFICNWLGNRRWVDALTWPGNADWGAEVDRQWLVDGNFSGVAHEAGPLSFLRVFQAGHMVPMDQPARSLAMIEAFTRGRPLGGAPVKGSGSGVEAQGVAAGWRSY